ncbi:AAA family ATPase [Thermoflexus sp.]|uniref:AAA family ATPase n=1 Tax=Thermoflexus sp. TaxID=1969742 RepID=UPI002ADD416E|nr:AAA family ATPase [Thermoflexus sp.]
MTISYLEIRNFKSIKELRIDCRRVNLFIGPPNTGKSNLLEALGGFSLPYTHDLKSVIRCETVSNLFYNEDIDNTIQINAGDYKWTLKFIGESNIFNLTVQGPAMEFSYRYSFDGTFQIGSGTFVFPSPFRFYRFRPLNSFPLRELDFLRPVAGENLMHLLLTRKLLRQLAADLLHKYDLRIVLKPQEGKIEIQREADGVIIAHPYTVLSDTLQRLIFHLIAIESNRAAILILEEPETHAFPFHTKYLAERIAMDSSNQYFISTHNPYFLLSILEKASQQDIRVFLTYWKDAQTRVRTLGEAEIEELIDIGSDLFFNLERLLERAGEQ